MRKLLVFTSFLFLLGLDSAFPQEKTKMIVLPLHYQNDATYSTNTYNSTRLLIFKSVYNFLAYLPFTDVPNSEQFIKNNPEFTEDSVRKLAEKQNVNFCLYGDFVFSGSAFTPDITINLYLYSRNDDKIIMTKKYEGSTDIDLFDAIDAMIKDSLFGAFNLTSSFAEVHITKFNIAKGESYNLVLNGKVLSTLSNKTDRFNFKVLADTPYNLQVIRLRDQGLVRNFQVQLSKNTSTNLSYTASGNIEILPLQGIESGKTYKILLDGQEVKPDTNLSNVDVINPHTWMVLDKNAKIVKQDTFTLKDGDVLKLKINLFAGKRLHFTLSTLGGSFVGLGLHYLIGDALWMETFATFSAIPSTYSGLANGEWLYQGSIDAGAGYYFYHSRPLRFGVGILGTYSQTFPDNLVQKSLLTSNNEISTSTFIQAEWSFVYLKVMGIYSITKNSFVPTALVGIQF